MSFKTVAQICNTEKSKVNNTTIFLKLDYQSVFFFLFVMKKCAFGDEMKGRVGPRKLYSSSVMNMTCSKSIQDMKNQFNLLHLS